MTAPPMRQRSAGFQSSAKISSSKLCREGVRAAKIHGLVGEAANPEPVEGVFSLPAAGLSLKPERTDAAGAVPSTEDDRICTSMGAIRRGEATARGTRPPAAGALIS